jgi:hypothetical protein
MTVQLTAMQEALLLLLRQQQQLLQQGDRLLLSLLSPRGLAAAAE